MNKPAKQMKEKPTKSNAKDKQRGFSIVELVFIATTLGTALLVAASRGPKIPPIAGD